MAKRGTDVTKARKLREFMARPGPIVIIGAHNGLSGEDRRGGGLRRPLGLAASRSRASYAVPDANILTMAENLHAAQDDERRHEHPRHRRLRQRLRQRDQRHPLRRGVRARRHRGHLHGGQHLPEALQLLRGREARALDVEEHAGKIRAAKATQRDEDFVVIARTEALIAGWGMEEALLRGRAYADAGADMVLIHSKSKDPDEVALVREAVGSAEHAARLRADDLQGDEGRRRSHEAGFKLDHLREPRGALVDQGDDRDARRRSSARCTRAASRTRSSRSSASTSSSASTR